jgi:hypothetical protein
MDSEHLSATAVTQEHLFKGTFSTDGQRLLDSLNDATTNFITMEDVEVFRASHNVRAAKLSTASVRKEHIGIVLVTSGRHEAPERQVNHRRDKQQFSAFLTCFGYDVKGTVHLRGYADPVNALSLDFEPFFPVTQAVVSHGGNAGLQVKVPVAMINRDAVSLFHLDFAMLSERDVVDSIRELMPIERQAEPQPSLPADWSGV